jgi:hypothetical protein
MRENLLGYLLGALDGPEHEAVGRELQRDRQLQRDLRRLETHLLPLENHRCRHFPPPGLAERTCELVARFRHGHGIPAFARRAAFGPAPATALGPVQSQWTLADLVVAAGVSLAAAMLFFPAIANSRYQARVVACQANLHELGSDLNKFSEVRGGYFPLVPTSGKLAAASIYAPMLVEAGLLSEPRILICPASDLAARSPNYRVPTIDQIQLAEGKQLSRLQCVAGGSLGYAFGYLENGQYRPIRNRGRRFFALVSDAPRFDLSQGVSDNHGGRGINVLFEDMHVRYSIHCRIGGCDGDDVFRNDQGRVEAGLHAEDSVIGYGATPPLPLQPAGYD